MPMIPAETIEMQAAETRDRIADKNAEIFRLRDALAWCSGSDDFQPGGKAREGWEKICQPLLAK